MEALQLVQELGSRSVDEVMISRSEMDALEADATVADWVERMAADQRRRFPVYRGHQDELLGVVSLRELLNSRSPRQQVGSFVRPVSFVPGTKKCDELLRQLWRSGEDMAVVVDEYGGVSGLVTREDLLEILVGNLLEEPGQDAARLLRIDRRTLLADGHYRIADFNEKFAAGLPEGEYETLSGLFLERLGRIPQTGERLSLNDVVLEVAARDDRRIQSIRVRLAGSRKPRSTQRTGTETN
jgi:CBS domain containing-hemolysin-like protein